MKICPTCGAIYADQLLFCGQDAAALVTRAQEDPFLGVVLEDRYKLEAVIGRGGFGVVYRAAHQRLPRDFAVKVLHAARAAEPVQVERFRQEVRAAAVLQHPNICEVIDFGHVPEVGHFVVMPLLAGETLLERLNRERSLPIVDIHAILTQTASALAAAHDQGIVHRDIKVENIFLAKDNSTLGYAVRLLDFGIAKVLHPDTDLRLAGPQRPPTEALQVIGSPLTMSPEQVRGQPVDARSDLYGLGVVLFEMLTGELPFVADLPADIMRMHVQQAPPMAAGLYGGRWVPPELDELVQSLLAKSPAARPQSARMLLERWAAVRPAAEEAWAEWHLGRPVSAQKGDLTRDPPKATDTERRTRRATAGIYHDAEEQGTVTQRAASQSTAAPRVLVVDDDEAIRSLIRAILQDQEWACTTVDSGPAALAWLKQHPAPVAVLLDMLMPGMDGLAALRAIRQSGYVGPVIFCSTLQSEGLRQEAESLGAQHFVNKGMELYKLPQLLAHLRTAPAPGA